MRDNKTESKNILETAKANIEKLCTAYDAKPDINFGELLKIVCAGKRIYNPQWI